jgi:hypothetical protein
MHYGALPKKTNIKGQPHELSYITPQEAGVLRMLGGAGKNVNGVPAYYTSIAAGYGQMADTLAKAPGGAVSLSGKKVGDTKDKKPKKQSEQTIMDLLKANNARARAEREAAAAAEAAKAAETLASSNVSPTSMVQMKDGKVLVSTNVGSGTENTYLDPETYTAMTGNQPPQNVQIRDDVSSFELDRTKPVDTTGFMEDVKAAGSDLFGLFSGDPLGNQEQNFFVPGYGDVMATSAADAFEKAQFFKNNPELVTSYAKGLGAPDFVTGDTDGDGIMDTYSGGGDVRVGDAITDPSLYANPAQADKFDSFGNVYPDDYFAGSGSDENFQLPTDEAYIDATNYGDYFDLFGGDDNFTVGGFEIPFSDDIYDAFTGTGGDSGGGSGGDGGGNGSGGGGTFPQKRDVYGNPIRLTKGGSSWWKMAANWTNPSERIDTYVTIDEQGNYITSDGKIVPEEIIATALLTPTNIQIKTGIEETQLPYYPTNPYDFQVPRMSDEEYNFKVTPLT